MAQSPSIKREKWIRLSLTWLVVILVSVVIIYPLVWTVGASLNAGNSLLSTSIIPENVSFQHYADLFNGNVNYLTWYWNSMKISFLTMVLTLISVSFTAYAFSRFRFKGRQNGLMLFLLLQMIPQSSALIAIFVLSTAWPDKQPSGAAADLRRGNDPDEHLADEGVSRRDP